jgi:hypothetical protein
VLDWGLARVIDASWFAQRLISRAASDSPPSYARMKLDLETRGM